MRTNYKLLLPLFFSLTVSLSVRSQSLLQKWLTPTNNDAITNSDDVPRRTIVNNAGNVAIIGESNGKIIIAAYDQYGNNSWTNKYNSAYTDYVTGFDQDNAGNYYAGYFWGGTIRKVTPNGNTAWTAGTSAYHGYCMVADANGGAFAVGTDYPQSTIYIDRLDANGNLKWTKTYTGYYGFGGQPTKVVLDHAGNLLIAMNATNNLGDQYLSVAKFDTIGTNPSKVWDNSYTTTKGQSYDLRVDRTTNACYITGAVTVGGFNQNDVIIYKSGPSGVINWSDVYNEANSDDKGYSLEQDLAGNVYVLFDSHNPMTKYSIRKYTSSGVFVTSNGVVYQSTYTPNFVPKLKIHPATHHLYFSGTKWSLSNDNMLVLYKTDMGLSGISQIYSYNHDVTNNDYSVSIDVDPISQNLILSGNIYKTISGNDYYYANTDTLGNFNFSNSYNGIINGYDEAADIKTDNNNDAVVAGSTKMVFTDYDGMLVKYDATGNVQFLNTYSGPDSLADRFLKVDTTSSGQYYAAGYVGRHNQYSWLSQVNDMWFMKTDVNGTKLWELILSGTQAYGDDQLSDLTVDASSNAFLTGWETNTGTGQDAVIMKVNPSGTILWKKKFTGSGNKLDGFTSIVKAGASAYYAAGYLTNPAGNQDVLVCKYDAAGNLSWSQTYNTPQNGNETAIAVTSDINNNVYVVCTSDSAKVITIKYSANGTLQWATANPLMTYVGPSIVANANGQVFITCGGGGTERIICYNNVGVEQWHKDYLYTCCDRPMKIRATSRGTILFAFDYYEQIGVIELDSLGNEKNNIAPYIGFLNESGGTRAMTIDKNGDVYVVGYFPIEQGFDVYTQKLCYTPAPIVVSGNTNACSGSTAVSYSVTANSTISTNNWTTPAGSTITNGSNTNNIAVSLGTASSGYITLQQSNSCGTSIPDSLYVNILPLPTVNGGADQFVCPGSSVTLSGSGAQVYVWSGGITNNTSFSATVTQNYQVIGTDINGCSNKDTVAIVLNTPPQADICMVTVDTLSTHNIILWDKTPYSGISYFNIYREDITNNYTLIGAVPYDSLSEYHDYDPAGNPNVTTKRYKIAVVDTCGNEGAKSDYHNTIYVANNNGTFSWNTYTIQGHGTPVSYYVLYRDSLSNGVWDSINSTAGSQNTITDLFYNNYPNGSWRIQTIWNISCTPTRGAINTSRSNIKISSVTGIMESKQTIGVVVYPNPFNNTLSFEIGSDRSAVYTLEITNTLGQIIRTIQVNSSKTIMNTDDWAAGVYFYKLYNSSSGKTGKIVKE